MSISIGAVPSFGVAAQHELVAQFVRNYEVIGTAADQTEFTFQPARSTGNGTEMHIYTHNQHPNGAFNPIPVLESPVLHLIRPTPPPIEVSTVMVGTLVDVVWEGAWHMAVVVGKRPRLCGKKPSESVAALAPADRRAGSGLPLHPRRLLGSNEPLASCAHGTCWRRLEGVRAVQQAAQRQQPRQPAARARAQSRLETRRSRDGVRR